MPGAGLKRPMGRARYVGMMDFTLACRLVMSEVCLGFEKSKFAKTVRQAQ